MTCRSGERFPGPWSAPAMMRLEGGGVGFQLGGQATDFVILVMNPRGAKALLKSKVKIGADAAAAAGPKGRDAAAASDVTMRAEMLTYSRSRDRKSTRLNSSHSQISYAVFCLKKKKKKKVQNKLQKS